MNVFLIIFARCVEAINFTHNPVDAQMDVKLRSLICLGLNEQVCTKYIIYIKYILFFTAFIITNIEKTINMWQIHQECGWEPRRPKTRSKSAQKPPSMSKIRPTREPFPDLDHELI